jgi:hypothetical protein
MSSNHKAHSRYLFFAVIAIGIIVIVSLVGSSNKSFLVFLSHWGTVVSSPAQYLTVAKVQENARMLDGQRVRVRGWAFLTTQQTLLGCEPWFCGCNKSWGELYLTEARVNNLTAFYTTHTPHIRLLDPICAGDECSMICDRFNPKAAPAFELAGTLMVTRSELYLKNVDLDTSVQLGGEGSLDQMTATPLQRQPSEIDLVSH